MSQEKSSQKKSALSTLYIWEFTPAECKKTKFCYLSHPSMWYFVIEALENKYNFHINTFENLK